MAMSFWVEFFASPFFQEKSESPSAENRILELIRTNHFLDAQALVQKNPNVFLQMARNKKIMACPSSLMLSGSVLESYIVERYHTKTKKSDDLLMEHWLAELSLENLEAMAKSSKSVACACALFKNPKKFKAIANLRSHAQRDFLASIFNQRFLDSGRVADLELTKLALPWLEQKTFRKAEYSSVPSTAALSSDDLVILSAQIQENFKPSFKSFWKGLKDKAPSVATSIKGSIRQLVRSTPGSALTPLEMASLKLMAASSSGTILRPDYSKNLYGANQITVAEDVLRQVSVLAASGHYTKMEDFRSLATNDRQWNALVKFYTLVSGKVPGDGSIHNFRDYLFSKRILSKDLLDQARAVHFSYRTVLTEVELSQAFYTNDIQKQPENIEVGQFLLSRLDPHAYVRWHYPEATNQKKQAEKIFDLIISGDRTFYKMHGHRFSDLFKLYPDLFAKVANQLMSARAGRSGFWSWFSRDSSKAWIGEFARCFSMLSYSSDLLNAAFKKTVGEALKTVSGREMRDLLLEMLRLQSLGLSGPLDSIFSMLLESVDRKIFFAGLSQVFATGDKSEQLKLCVLECIRKSDSIVELAALFKRYQFNDDEVINVLFEKLREIEPVRGYPTFLVLLSYEPKKDLKNTSLSLIFDFLLSSLDISVPVEKCQKVFEAFWLRLSLADDLIPHHSEANISNLARERLQDTSIDNNFGSGQCALNLFFVSVSPGGSHHDRFVVVLPKLSQAVQKWYQQKLENVPQIETASAISVR